MALAPAGKVVESSRFMIDFVKLLGYFKKKYPNLKAVRYYEGIATDDAKKRKTFEYLERAGYTICPLERKSYNSVEIVEQNMECPKCNYQWTVKTRKDHKAMKSNVDVYLATDMIVQVSLADCPTRLILVSCDGDYAEAIKNIVKLNSNVTVAVLATPYVRVRNKNTLSVRLKSLLNELSRERYRLHNIDALRSQISSNRYQR